MSNTIWLHSFGDEAPGLSLDVQEESPSETMDDAVRRLLASADGKRTIEDHKPRGEAAKKPRREPKGSGGTQSTPRSLILSQRLAAKRAALAEADIQEAIQTFEAESSDSEIQEQNRRENIRRIEAIGRQLAELRKEHADVIPDFLASLPREQRDISAMLTTRIHQHVAYWNKKRGHAKKQVLAILERNLEQLSQLLAEKAPELRQQREHDSLSLIERHARLRRDYGDLVGLLKGRTARPMSMPSDEIEIKSPHGMKRLLDEAETQLGDLRRLQRLHHQLATENQFLIRGLHGRTVMVLSMSWEELARKSHIRELEQDLALARREVERKSQAFVSAPAPSRRRSDASRKTKKADAPPKTSGTGPVIAGPNPQGRSQRGRHGTNAKGETAGTKGATRRKKGKK
jgi:hypothetical protein